MVDWNDPLEVKEYFRQNYQKNKKRKRELNKIWRANNKEKVKAEKKKWAEDNRDKRREINKRYRENNKDSIKESRKRDKDNISARWKRWYSKTKGIRSKNAKKYYRKNKKYLCLICDKPANSKYCSKKCQGTTISGKNNYFWYGGTSHEHYDTKWNNSFKKSIRKRDNYICMLCTQHQKVFKRLLSIHHIDGDKKNSVKENCISLCDFCHQAVEKDKIKKKEYYEPLFYNLLKKLYGY